MTAAPRLHQVLDGGQAAGLDGEYASDHWHAARLGVPARRGRGTVRFDTITQGWLREAVKRWSRFRLATVQDLVEPGGGGHSECPVPAWSHTPDLVSASRTSTASR